MMNRLLLANIITVLILAFISGCAPSMDEAKYSDAMYAGCGDIANIECLRTKGWIFETSTLKHIEELSLKSKTEVGHRRWKAFVDKYETGDDIWYFSSPPDTWVDLIGQAGYIILRSNKLVAKIQTKIS